MARFDHILQTIGKTPVVRIQKLGPAHVNLHAKLESFNPGGSVKDRLALGVIEDAERRGVLRPGQTVIEATSGNTGIGLAIVCAQKGYPLVVVMGENFSIERRKILRFLGAKVILTPAWGKGTGMLAKTMELAETHGWFLCRQFDNEANADIHSQTTAVEILEDFQGQPLDYWVTGAGTGGTLKGVARVLKEKRPETKIIVCEPDTSRTIASRVPQKRRSDGTPDGSHPAFSAHLIQGWGPDFIPTLVQDSTSAGLIDGVIGVDSAEAIRLSRELAVKEGIFTGISGGATLAGALHVAREAPEGATILFMLPDTGERYLSTLLFSNIAVDMTEEELTISTSTPNYRFDAPPPAVTAGSGQGHTVDLSQIPEEIKAQVARWIEDPSQPVALFSFAWCEFCLALCRFLDGCKISYRTIELDSVENQRDERGLKIRAVISARSGAYTIPQVFVRGEFVGGLSDIVDGWKAGTFQALLRKHEVPFDATVATDPASVQPNWLQPRVAACVIPPRPPK